MDDNNKLDIDQYELDNELACNLSELRLKLDEVLNLIDPDDLRDFVDTAIDEILTKDNPGFN